jgi:hypothetical protein
METDMQHFLTTTSGAVVGTAQVVEVAGIIEVTIDLRPKVEGKGGGDIKPLWAVSEMSRNNFIDGDVRLVVTS